MTIKPRKPVGEDGDHVARLVTEDHGARSCTQCAHLPVCVVIRGLTSGCQAAFQGVDSKDWPVTPSSLAIICRAYAVRFEGVRA